jgi:S1/P1 Nuclease
MPRFLAVLLAAILLSGPAFAWGREGHAIVADIAESQLTPQAWAAAQKLLALDNASHLSDIASWADQIKQDQRADPDAEHVAHSIRLPLDHSGYVPDLCPSHFWAVAALLKYDSILSNHSLPDAQREEALKYVVHLVGDIHQPLHTSANTGGHVFVMFDGRQTWLHKVWDTDIIRDHGGSTQAVARELISTERDLNYGGDPASWALEGRDIARDEIFSQIPQAPAQTITLPSNYGQTNWPIVAARLTQAGMRLAAMLNKALG